MATLGQILYNILNIKGGGTVSDDSKITKRQLEFIVNHFRAELASQRTNQSKSLDGFYQELTNVKLVSTRDFKAYNKDVIILKSVERLPFPVTCHENGFVLQYVGLRDDVIGFQSSSVHTYNLDIENKYVSRVYFIVDNYLYVALKYNTAIREVFVRGVFADPREVIQLHTGENLLMGYDWEYPIPAAMLSQLNGMVINNEYRWMNMLPPDILNNGRDDKQ